MPKITVFFSSGHLFTMTVGMVEYLPSEVSRRQGGSDLSHPHVIISSCHGFHEVTWSSHHIITFHLKCQGDRGAHSRCISAQALAGHQDQDLVIVRRRMVVMMTNLNIDDKTWYDDDVGLVADPLVAVHLGHHHHPVLSHRIPNCHNHHRTYKHDQLIIIIAATQPFSG